MKNLLVSAVLLLSSVSGFAFNPMPECGDGDTHSTVSFNQIQDATERLIKVAAIGTNQQAEMTRLKLIIGRAEMTHVQYLVLNALNAQSKNLQSVRVQSIVCPSERASSMNNVQDAERVILNLRALMSKEALSIK